MGKTLTPQEVQQLMPYLSGEERRELEALVAQDLEESIWRPLPGPQSQAYYSEADVVGFGGAAGGGKSEMGLGLALTTHLRTQFVQREGPRLQGVLDRLLEVTGEEAKGKPPIWRGESGGVQRQISFNSIPTLGDERKYQGIPKDLLVIDEAANALEEQVRFLKGWVRTTVPGQRTRTLLTFNPPTSAEGRWIIDYFAPWLDKRHDMYPTAPGELRWVYTDPRDGKDHWLSPDERTDPFILLPGGGREYDFDPVASALEDIVTPESRTFIPSKVSDNPYLAGTGYIATLQALPEPLRSQMLYGDFQAGMGDDPWQVIPTAWVDEAMARWSDDHQFGELMALGVDVARGGQDDTVVARRYADNWYGKPIVEKGEDTPNGRKVAGLVISNWGDDAPIMIDIIGVGASPYDVLRETHMPVHAVDARASATASDKSGKLKFANLRSQLWWKFRELLDPANPQPIVLPNDKRLARELCAPRFDLRGNKIYVESRKEIIKRAGASPDSATAYIMAAMDIPKTARLDFQQQARAVLDYDPYADM